jgi:hypothetical protein
MLTLRELVESEVSFETTLEADDSDPADHFMSGEPEYEEADRKLTADIRARSERGDVEAWCGVIVTARWGSYEGHGSIWGSSLDDTYTADVVVKEYDLRGEALDDLNRKIAAAAAAIAPLLES